MDILLLTPFGASEPGGAENVRRIARDDVELTAENQRDIYPLNYNTYQYNVLKSANAAVERIALAEEEGYDGVVLSCQQEPGLHQARSIVDIPIVGTMEASCVVASQLGRRFSLLAPDRVNGELEADVVTDHGFGDMLASTRWIDISPPDLYPEKTPPSVLRERSVEVAKECVVEDHAEVLVSGCTIFSAVLTEDSPDPVIPADLLDVEADIPLIDSMVAGVKLCEMMVDLHQLAGYPSASRIGSYRSSPEDEFDTMRAWLRDHESPEQHYIRDDLEVDEGVETYVSDD